jgi:NHL repeat
LTNGIRQLTSHVRARARLALAVVVLCATTAALVALAAAAPKYYGSFIGGAGANSGTAGGLFNTPRDIAVNQATGQIYVVDDVNHRIQRFDEDGGFERAWGRDVVQAGGTGDTGTTGFETCTVASDCKAGTTGAEGGMMDNPQGIAVDQDTGDVYVTDRDNLRVQRFDSDGSFERAFGWDVTTGGPETFEVCDSAADCKAGDTGAGAGQFAASPVSYRVAVSPPDGDLATGSVFVADAPNRRVQQFDLDGDFVRAWGWGVATGANAFEVCTATCIAGAEAFTSSPNGQFANGHPLHVAVDARGAVYASDSGGQNRVLRFDASEGPADQLLEPPVNPAAVTGTLSSVTSGLEVDPDSDGMGSDVDRLLVSRSVAIGVLELALPTDPAGAAVHADTHLRGSNVAPQGLGVNTGLGRLYVSSTSNGHRVWVADEDGAGAPILTVDSPTGVGAHGASFSGTVNPAGPAGFPTSYRFQYSKSGSTWTDVATPVSVGDGTSPIPVSADVTGLEAGTLYWVRLVGTKAFGNPDIASPEVTFVTHATAPDAQTFHPRKRTATTVELTGQIDPGGRPTEYRFEYGTSTNYGSEAPVPDATVTGGSPKVVSTTIESLEPDAIYHYRLVAENEHGTDAGQDVAFRTRARSDAPPGRAYEMVTPPVKATTTVGSPHIPGRDANPGFPSLDGERVVWSVSNFPLLDSQAFPFGGEIAVAGRGANGWTMGSLLTKPPLEGSVPGAGTFASMRGLSGDFAVQAWRFALPLLENEGANPLEPYTRRDGTGAAGFTGWLRNVNTQQVGTQDEALFSDDGAWMARWGRYRGLLDDPATPAAEDPSVSQVAGAAGGSTVYLQAAPPTGELDLVNECTGTGAGATQIPERFDNGTPATPGDDLLDARDCVEGEVTSNRGAVLGANSGTGSTSPASAHLEGPAATAMSQDGRRVFFMSPDPTASGLVTSCGTSVGSATSCPPQLYVRQYDENGENPVVRWISRPAAGMPAQQIGLLGRGASFEGASRDGRYVYFRTNAPLTPDDRNGAGAPGPVTTGIASPNSWDLYRYELPADLDEDPAGGTLTRISGGPTGDADAGTNHTSGGGSAARHLSDDGKRAYLVTNTPIAGADVTPPFGGVTTPGGAGPNPDTRNLYLFDDSAAGAARYRFIARLPSGIDDDIDECSTFFGVSGPDVSPNGFSTGTGLGANAASCFRGSRTGSTVVFLTRGQLTGDDTDEAADIYVYDAEEDELVRVSAPPPGESPYVCRTASSGQDLNTCNAGLGFGPWALRSPGGWDTARGWGGGRQHNLAENASGVSVFFETRLSLLPDDTNAGHWDTYEWREGQLALVSPGNTDDHSYFSGVSADGEDAFFNTTARIDPREISDKDFDVYDARVGGGFPSTPAPLPCDVLAGGCGGPALPAPATLTPVTPVFVGPGNVTLGERATRDCSGLNKKLKKARRRLARASGRPAKKKLRRQIATFKRRLERCRRAGE